MKTVMFVLGTRPEAIKLAPVILELKKYPDRYKVIICNTEQQKELSHQTLSFFALAADINLDVMQPNQLLSDLQSRILQKIGSVYDSTAIDATIVQGDTMTVFCGALSSYYRKIPVFHVEAGLRSHNLFEPFPEEALRQMTARIATLHFAPTQQAVDSLRDENIPAGSIVKTGNTVIDALLCLSNFTLGAASKRLKEKGVLLNDRVVLVTVHRRENHGERLGNILSALIHLVQCYPTHQFVLPVHPNPNVHERVRLALSPFNSVVLTDPLDYPELVCLMQNAKLIMTDSGGIQEEAPTFGVPTLVMRYETERKEGVELGFAKLVGADTNTIVKEAVFFLDKEKAETRLPLNQNPYGDGKAASRVEEAIWGFFGQECYA